MLLTYTQLVNQLIENIPVTTFQFYLFITVFIGIFLIAYIFYRYNRAKYKKKYIKKVLTSPILHAFFIIGGSLIFINFFISNTTKNKRNIAKNCEEKSEIAYQKALKFVRFDESIVDFEDAFYKLADDKVCWIEKNQFKVNWNEKTRNMVLLKEKENYLFSLVDLFNNKYKFATLKLKNNNFQKMQHFNYYNGIANYNYGNYTEAFESLSRNYKNKKNRHPKVESAFGPLIYKNLGAKAFLTEYKSPKLSNGLSFQKKMHIAISKKDLKGFLKRNFSFDKINLKSSHFLFPFFILIIWLIYVRSIDYFDKEKWIQIFASLAIIFVSLIVFYALFYLLFDGYIHQIQSLTYLPVWLKYCLSVGFVKELIKFVPILIIWKLTNFIDEPYDFLLYAGLSGICFAFLENFISFEDYKTGMYFESGIFSSVMQFSLSALAVSSFVFNYTLKRFISKIGTVVFFFLAAAFLHGIYNYLLIEKPTIYPLFIAILFFFTLFSWQILANNALNFSPYFTYNKKFNLKNAKYFLIIALTLIWMAEYVLIGIDESALNANNFFSNHFVFSVLILVFADTNLFKFDFVKRYWRGITPYKSGPDSADFYESGAFSFFDLLSLKMLYASNGTQNYVGYDIDLMPSDLNYDMKKNINKPLSGLITDRKVIIPKEKAQIGRRGDPYWFVVKLDNAINVDGTTCHEVLMRFKDNNPNLDNSTAQIAMLYHFPNYNLNERKIIVLSDLLSLGNFDVEKF